MRIMKSVIAILLTAAMLLSLAACGASSGESGTTGAPEANNTTPAADSGLLSPKKVQAADLLEPFTAQPVEEKQADEAFTGAGFDWALRLFKETYTQEKDNKTLLVSPLSVMTALAMTANGAKNNTLAEMEKVLGGEIKLEDLNAYLHTYLNSLPSSEKAKFSFANAIWFKDQADFTVEDSFLQKNVNYYDAAIRKASFDDSTVQEVNQWVDLHTDHMIQKLLNELRGDERMLLVNALAFDAKWGEPFEEENCWQDVFTNLQGGQDEATYMSATVEAWLEDEEVTGFVKDYEGGTYRFVALLPKDEKGFETYIKGLTGEKIANLLQNEKQEQVLIQLPKFSYDYSASLSEVLKALGIKDAFGGADFSGISVDTPLVISDVLHKTHIDLDSEGTRAAAVTAVIMAKGAYIQPANRVFLTRPFVYMIVDSATNLPIFIGTVTGLEK